MHFHEKNPDALSYLKLCSASVQSVYKQNQEAVKMDNFYLVHGRVSGKRLKIMNNANLQRIHTDKYTHIWYLVL